MTRGLIDSPFLIIIKLSLTISCQLCWRTKRAANPYCPAGYPAAQQFGVQAIGQRYCCHGNSGLFAGCHNLAFEFIAVVATTPSCPRVIEQLKWTPCSLLAQPHTRWARRALKFNRRETKLIKTVNLGWSAPICVVVRVYAAPRVVTSVIH